MFEQLLAFAAVSLLVLVPGLLLSWALFYHLPFGRFMKFFFGAILGLVAVPALGVLEFAFLGIKMSAGLVFANAALLSALGIGLWFFQRKSTHIDFAQFTRHFGQVNSEFAKKYVQTFAILILLVLVVLFGFYGRIATSWAPVTDGVFFEFDPYYYDLVTEMIAKNGATEVTGPDAFFPQGKFHRDVPLLHYMTAGWYLVYQSIAGGVYDKMALVSIIQIYPPLVGALLSFLAFAMLRDETGDKIALLVAAMFAFTPQLIKKLGAGVSEQQPFGIFLMLLIFAVFALAVKHKSLRLAVFASASVFFAMIGTLQFIFPFMVLTGFILVQSLLDFVLGRLDRKSVAINATVAAGAVFGNIVLNIYQAAPIGLANGVILLLASLVPSILLLAATEAGLLGHAHAASRRHNLSDVQARAGIVAGVLGLLLVLFIFSPLSAKVVGYVDAVLGISKTGKPILKTVQEEGGSNPIYDESSYGFFHGWFGPENLLVIVTLLVCGLMVLDLLSKKRETEALIAGSVAVAIVAFNGGVDFLVQTIAGILGLGQSVIVQSFMEQDTLVFMAVSIAAVSISYLVSDRKSTIVLFSLLIFFPTAFIGLEKVKYTLHLAFALCILFGFLLAESARLFEEIAKLMKLAQGETAAKLSHSFVVIIGTLMVGAQFVYAVGSPMMISCDSQVNSITSQFAIPGVQTFSSIGTLCYGRITSDWLQATDWMKTSTPLGSRFMSWWDYGHWTTFFGERYTVIDPNNAYDEYDQEVAHAIVGDSFGELRRTMEYHNATYLMLDSELVPKWGALVYLSGTFGAVKYETPNGAYTGLYREPDPKNNYNATPGIVEWEKGPGQSTYEQEHYFENLYAVFSQDAQSGQIVPMPCPGKIQRPAYYSTLTGAIYCLFQGKTQEEMKLFLLKDGRTGEQVPLENPKLLMTGSDPRAQLKPIADNVFIDVNPASSRSFLNLNPDVKTISGGTLQNKLFNSMFVQFYFCDTMGTCEKLKEQGFEYAYHSPNGQVKIFRKTN